jgi:hypothetical protein
MLVVSEPAPLNTLLAVDRSDDDAVRMLRQLVRALGRRRFGTERHYVLKLSSWNVTRVALFRRAFPAVPLIWAQRSPVEVMASLLADPPAWMELRRLPDQARSIFGAATAAAASDDCELFCARALAATLTAALAAEDGPALTLDYRDLPDAVWTIVAPFLGIDLSRDAIAAMREEARFYSKEASPRPFQGDAPDKRQVSDRARGLAADLVEPIYRALDRRRREASRSFAAAGSKPGSP